MRELTVISDYGELEESIVANFEYLKNVKFPKNYTELICKHNGLSFVESWFDYIKEDGEVEEASFSFLTYGDFAGASLILSSQDFDIYGYDKVINFGVRGNGDYIAFDYRKNPDSSEPEIVLMYHDAYVLDENGHPKMLIVKISDDFDSFINMLHE